MIGTPDQTYAFPVFQHCMLNSYFSAFSVKNWDYMGLGMKLLVHVHVHVHVYSPFPINVTSHCRIGQLSCEAKLFASNGRCRGIKPIVTHRSPPSTVVDFQTPSGESWRCMLTLCDQTDCTWMNSPYYYANTITKFLQIIWHESNNIVWVSLIFTCAFYSIYSIYYYMHDNLCRELETIQSSGKE